VLAHEVLHPALLHPFRLGDRDLKIANVAADYAINNFLDNYNNQAVAIGQVAPFPWPTLPNGFPDVLLDHSYDGMSFEEIYAKLSQEPSGGSAKQPPKPQLGGSGGQDPSTRQSPDPGNEEPNGNGDGQGPSSPGEFIKAAQDESEAKIQEDKWKVAVKQAVTTAKAQGRIPAEIQRLVTELLDPKQSWREILRTLLTSVAKDDYTWTRPNPRYAGRGVILPSLYVPRMGKVAVAIDTSGSIDQEQLNEFLAEVRGILFDCRPEKMILIECDAQVHQWLELDPCDEVGLEVKGGGGTDFRPVFERIAQEPEPPAALVYLTDLCGDFPQEPPPYPVVWACNNADTGPFGETVNI
jgi:predicted metal-dependent peptidase